MSEATSEGALAAINEALGTGEAPAAADEATLLENAEHDTGETPELETPADEKPEGEGEDESTDAEGTPRARNPDGTFKKTEAEDKAAADKAAADAATKAAEKPGEKPVEKPVEKKAPDALNDPIPKDLKQETQERIRTLVKTTKDMTAERDQIRTDFDYMVKGVQSTGATPEQYGEALSWLAMFNSNDPEQQSKALELVENVADRLATLLGKERQVSDPLTNHADLVEAVRSGQVTAQYAREIARTRQQQNFRMELSTAATAEQRAQQQREQETTTARASLNALEVELRSTDPHYEAKKAVLVSVLKPVFASIPPSQWEAKFREAYRNVPAPAPRARAPGVPPNQPLRANKQPAGGQTKAPSSMLEAIDGALASMGR
jgi:hypothetical protein